MVDIFHKKPKKHFIVEYVLNCDVGTISETSILFDKKWMVSEVVHADDMMEAGVEFAKKHCLSPNICIHRIKELNA